MGAIFKILVRFWKPIATGIGSVVAWEQVDDVVAPEEKDNKISGLLVLVSLFFIALLGYLTGVLKVSKKKRR